MGIIYTNVKELKYINILKLLLLNLHIYLITPQFVRNELPHVCIYLGEHSAIIILR